ncbi:formate dehydrogenase accessory protein FdhE [Desulfonatronovibrio hydrogenovorans]|uniref:formate dehydrogenase accessory protein FdhE n=1 Tax=Desulfonatronovibrio hydrogenovorans TaxID=53245 RepID=UPI00048CD77E|nr:formate dehydrogenase accessory protein FdhE [Desulfonatronovibrio hydrogenovorans]
MYQNPDKSLVLMEKRKKVLQGQNILPLELIELISTVFQEQLRTYEGLESSLKPGTSLTPVSQVASGKPLLARESFEYDFEASKSLFNFLLDHLINSSSHLSQAARIIADQVSSDPDLIKTAFLNHLKGDDLFFRTFGEKTPSGPRALNFLVQTSMTPSIARTARDVSLALPKDQTWTSGHCPVCGSLPFISVLRGKQGSRHMHCSFCHTDYRFKRMICPFCHENKSENFEYFTVKEHPGFRVDVCKSCKMYIKTCDFRDMDRKELPVLDDLESLPLDIMARNQGYMRPTLSAWGF